MSERDNIEQPSAAPAADAKAALPDGPASESKIEAGKPEAGLPHVEAAILAQTSAPPIVEPESDEPKSSGSPGAPEAARNERVMPLPGDRVVTLFSPTGKHEAPPPRSRRLGLLAASVAAAAALGALVGALGASGLMGSAAPSEVAKAETSGPDGHGLESEIAQMRSELAAIRTGVETVSRTTTAQLAKFAERIDKTERAQAEPAAKLAKAIESLERLERRAEGVTGSIPAPQPAAAVVPARPPQSVPPLQSGIVSGWTLQDVYRGVALIQGSRFGAIEVEAGDMVPGLGRIEAIRKQDGRWVVVTAKGLIVAAR